jgi:hypothetical protein
MGGEIGSVIPSDANVIEATTDGGGFSFSDGFHRCAIRCLGGSSYFETPSVGGQTTIWYHFNFIGRAAQTSSSQQVWAIFHDDSGVAQFRLKGSIYGQTLRLERNASSVWTLVDAEIPLNANSASSTSLAMQTFDLGLVVNSASGSAKLYVGGTKRIDSGSIDLSGVASMNKMQGYGRTVVTSESNYFSQIVIADEPTVGMRVTTVPPAGAGTTGDWTGDYTDVDEAVYSDADFCYSATNGQIELFVGTVPSLTGYVVRAVGVYARAKCGASGPQNLQIALRSGSTNYFSSSLALDVGYDAHGNVWEQNPNTTADWQTAQISAVQFGVKAIT